MKSALDELTYEGNWETDEQWMDGHALGYCEVNYVGEPVFMEARKELAALRAERDEAVRLLEAAGGFVNYLAEHIDADTEEQELDKEIQEFLSKVKP